jgi:hypothetical protein
MRCFLVAELASIRPLLKTIILTLFIFCNLLLWLPPGVTPQYLFYPALLIPLRNYRV